MFEKILENMTLKRPLVHNITNYVTVNDCANIVLACGGSPIMADEQAEVEDIQTICSALVLNIGTLSKNTINAMITAGKKANLLNHPVILDPVGVGASKLRTETVFKLLEEVKFTVIRGNISEIKCVYQGTSTVKGVDADENDTVNDSDIEKTIKLAKDLSKRTGAIIVITGAIDIVADDTKVYIIRNGSPMMSKITGTGCMLTCVIGSFCGANNENYLDGTAAAVCAMGLCGEIAYSKTREIDGGTASFRMFLIDAMSKMTPSVLSGGVKIEDR